MLQYVTNKQFYRRSWLSLLGFSILLESVPKEAEDTFDPELAHKILGPVAYDRGFHFFLDPGVYSGETAISLLTFSLDLETIEMQSIRFHFDRGDFQKWIGNTLGDEELANRIDRIVRPISDDALREQLIAIVKKRLVELETFHASH